MDLYTDASGTHGWVAYWSGRWIYAQWSTEHAHKNITWKELYAIAAAVNKWGHLWQRKKVYSTVTTSQYAIYGKKGLLGNRRSWPLYVCCTFVLPVLIYM